MGYKFNPFVGNFDKVVSDSYLDAGYLRLDCSNDPLTGVLHIDDKIEYTDTTEYIDQEAWYDD